MPPLTLVSGTHAVSAPLSSQTTSTSRSAKTLHPVRSVTPGSVVAIGKRPLRCSEQIAHSLLFCGARTNQEFAQQSLAIKSSNLNVDNLWRQNRRHRVGFASVAPDRSDVPLNIRDVNDDEDAVWKRLTDGEIARLKGPVVTRATGLRGAAQVGGAGKTVHRRLSAAWSLSGVGRSAPCGVAPTSAGKSHFPITVQKRAAARQADDHQSALDRS